MISSCAIFLARGVTIIVDTTEAIQRISICNVLLRGYRNVLVGEKHLVKISDFGLSRALAKDDSYYKVSQASKLPVKWMALESLLFQKFSTYSDGKMSITQLNRL